MTVVQLPQSGQAYHEGSMVWVPSVDIVNSGDGNSKKKINCWRRGRVQSIINGSTSSNEFMLAVRSEDGAVIQAIASECYLQNERDDTVDDLVRSDFLHEPGILHTLQVRYGMDSIYTYSGQILIATNPHKRLKHLYGPRMMTQYRNVPLGELTPHVYAIAEAAYAAMMADEQRQAILVSGESGAGKTESAKMVMQYLAHRAGPSIAASSGAAKLASSNGPVSAPIEEQVLESNPLLEAFGNAKTARNDNSSRFGKFVEIDFDAGGRVTGAAISTYLLERSRVVSIRSPERSFHIFYQLCAGADAATRSELRLEGGAAGFRYLAQSDAYTLADVDDGDAFAKTLEAMRVVGLRDESIKSIVRCVAAVLHLGNIEFEASSRDEAVVIGGEGSGAVQIAAELLQVTPGALATALTTRAIETRGERIVKTLDPAEASESRDALAKSLYSRLFDWLVAAVNRKIGALGGGASRTARSIGILDIYGFECFDTNSFEQLCINLANEKLQQAFNAHVFKGEQAEYAREGIAWSYVDFVDNQDVLDLLEGAANSAQGVFPLIDEACRLPRATYQDLAHALRTRLKDHPRFGIPRRNQNAFAVDHYAGEVCYSTEALLDKNRDFVVAEHAGLMSKSAAPLLQELFAAVGGGGGGTLESSSAGNAGIGVDAHTLSPVMAQSRRRSAFMLSTVGSRFRRQLGGLMSTLGECEPHFIRCIKPNSASQPGALTPPYVLEQLRAGGVLEAVRIACAGYPTRKPFLPFAQRFAVLLGGARLRELGLPITSTGFVDWYAAAEQQVADVVKRVLKNSPLDGWQMGRTRVFLRAGQLAQLEGTRGRLLAVAAVKIQAVWRARDARLQFARAKAAVLKIQAAWREYVRIKEEERKRHEAAAVCIQTAWKSFSARSAFLSHQRTVRATVIQANWRRYSVRTKFLEETEAGRRATAKAEEDARLAVAATVIQSSWRRVLAQKHAAVLRKQAERMKAVQQERDALSAERAALVAALAAVEARAARAEADAAAKAAHISTLQSESEELVAELQSSRLEASAAVSATAAGATAAEELALRQSTELESAHKRAAAALREELEVAHRQRSDADERADAAESRLGGVQAEVDALRVELAKMVAAAEDREIELATVKDQLTQANKDIELLRVTTAAAAAAAAVEAAAMLKQAEERATTVQASLSRTSAAEVHSLKKKLAESDAKASRHAAALKDAQEKSSQLAARVEALSSRAERLESDAHSAADREATLLQELDNTRRAAAIRTRAPSPLAAVSIQSPAVSTPQRRTIAQELDAAATDIEASSPARANAAVGAGELVSAHTALVAALTEAVVFHRLPCVEAWSGPTGTLKVPQAAWLLHRCLLQWAREWRASEVAAAAHHIGSSIAAAAIADRGMSFAGYLLSVSLATGALLKMRVIGKPDLQQLFKLADSFIGLTDLHVALGAVVSEEIPVNVALLLSEDAKRSARRRSVNRTTVLIQDTTTVKTLTLLSSSAAGGGGGTTASSSVSTPVAVAASPASSAPSPSASPADVELAHMGAAERHWRALLGGIANIVEVLRSQSVPPAAIRAVVWATLRYIDCELLNALLLRRDCCSVSAAKALQTGLTALQDVRSFVGAEWACDGNEAGRALERSLQASRYLVQGKDDCARKALRGINVLPDLARQCPALTLQQVHRLTEHQHDDWLAGAGSAVGSQTLVLLDTLRKLMNDNKARLGGGGAMMSIGVSNSSSCSTANVTPATAATTTTTTEGGATPSRWVNFTEDESPTPAQQLDEEDLLVDSSAPFAMFRVQHPRRLLTEAAKSFVVAPGGSGAFAFASTGNTSSSTAPGGGGAPTPPQLPSSSTVTPGPRLPNGKLPQLSSPSTGNSPNEQLPPRTPAPATLSLLVAIDQGCASAGIPVALESNLGFSFLK